MYEEAEEPIPEEIPEEPPSVEEEEVAEEEEVEEEEEEVAVVAPRGTTAFMSCTFQTLIASNLRAVNVIIIRHMLFLCHANEA